MDKKHKAYIYARSVVDGKIPAPKYVRLQCSEFLQIADNKSKDYIISIDKLNIVESMLSLMVMAKGLAARQTVKETLSGFQWLMIVCALCVVHRDDPSKRRYETVVLEICRKNGKTFLVAVIFIILLLTEPKFSRFFSVAPDGSLSREIKTQIEEILKSSPALMGNYNGLPKFKTLRDYISCTITENKYEPLNYSTSRLDGKLPSVYIVDESGALPNAYAIEAMRSGQLTIKNKLGFVISTKYPTYNNPFEDEISYCKKILDGVVDDDTVFALLYEPDNTVEWMTDDTILKHGNPLALEVPEILEDLLHKRQQAIEVESRRENFLCKHCNIIYQGVGTESYVSVADLKQCAVSAVDWSGRDVYLGVDLAMSNDNTAVSMVAYDEESEKVLCKSWCFVPQDRILEKNRAEKMNYFNHIEHGECFGCGERTIDYKFVEDFVLQIQDKYGVKIQGIGYDRFNCLSSAQKWEDAELTTCEVKQHSSVLHPPTKWLSELIVNKQFVYEENRLLEINFENAKCTFDTNLNRYVSKKKSSGKIDMVMATLDALYLLQQNVVFNETMSWGVQII